MQLIHPKIFSLYQLAAQCLIGVPLLFYLGSRPAMADDVDQICNVEGQKTWYVAIGKDVFALPYEQFFDQTSGPLVDNVSGELALKPPDPNAPLGCKDNPQQISRFAVRSRPEIEPVTYTGPMPQSIDLLEMYRYPSSKTLGPNNDPIIENWVLAALACQNKHYIQRSEDGTILCTNVIGQLNPLLNQQTNYLAASWEYIISANLYRTPLGENLIEDENLNSIDVFYLLSPDVLLHYNWIPPKSATSIDPEYLIALDKLFLSKISSYQVKTYRWPE